jgi:uncharacterized protein YceK
LKVKLSILFFLLACGIVFERCGTTISITIRDKGDPIIYGGTRKNIEFIKKADHPHNYLGSVFRVIAIIDFPFSLVLDTAIIPFTAAWALYDGHFDSKNIIYYVKKNDLEKVIRSSRQPLININITDEYGRNAIHCAVLRNNSIEIIKYLLGIGVDPNNRDKHSETILVSAVTQGNPEVIKLLIDFRADLNAKNGDGWTPLMLAARRGSADIVSLLLERKADPGVKNNKGQTALMLVSDRLDDIKKSEGLYKYMKK